ncbi:hypothetical protein BKA66DRAFT_435761 [Pyrenochaeta sp. MPI-SDFR-AT-0127]|nr:hypothetical protein BKA66DRAFT_435761 [Pyrenochaeta sp. MPI-SDFR-AT-0127]
MPRGRPRKYKSKLKALDAKKYSDRMRYLQKTQRIALVKFIVYQPNLYSSVPTKTNPRLNLRISSNITIPIEPVHNKESRPKET